MKKKNTKKRKRINTGDAITNRLYTAVRDYVEKHKGSVVVIGGMTIVDEGKSNSYGVMVRCLGRRPSFSTQAKREG